jgi:hypothetical protein
MVLILENYCSTLTPEYSAAPQKNFFSPVNCFFIPFSLGISSVNWVSAGPNPVNRNKRIAIIDASLAHQSPFDNISLASLRLTPDEKGAGPSQTGSCQVPLGICNDGGVDLFI